MITLMERAAGTVLDDKAVTTWESRYGVPLILEDGNVYDAQLQRFLADLPLNGARSRHSLRSYGYDIVVWLRFLDARGKTVWQAARADVDAYHRARRHDDAANRISPASWNRAVAALDKLYRWGVEEALVAQSPFIYRDVWRQSSNGGRASISARNNAYERAAKRADVKFVTMEDYRLFRGIGLKGLTPEGLARPGARDRNGARNALFADLLISTGLRLEEASSLLTLEIEQARRSGSDRQVPFRLAAGLTKGDKGRTIRVPAALLGRLRGYCDIERAVASDKFRRREGWQRMPGAIFCHEIPDGRIEVQTGEDIWRTCNLDRLTPDERRRLVTCDANGEQEQAAALWLTEDGRPVAPNSWEVAFARASKRCRDAGFSIDISPHQLRHSFAVHMLALLIQQQIGDATDIQQNLSGTAYRQLLGDPLQQVQRLLGHSSITTTYIYLDHLAGCQDTVDAAVEELLAGIDGGAASMRIAA